MAAAGTAQRDLSARRIVGFACNQAFVFFLLYCMPACDVVFGDVCVRRFDALCTLAFMVVGFGAARALGSEQVGRLFARPLLYVFSVVAAAGSLLPLAFPGHELYWVVAQGALVGVPIAYLLTAWGRAFGLEPTGNSIPEVFLGSLAGALVCLVFSLAASSEVALLVLRALPLASVVNIEAPIDGPMPAPATVEAGSGQAQKLSAKVLAGTLLFGVAAGLCEDGFSVAGVAADGVFALPYCQVSFVLFGAFLIGALSLLLSNGFGRGASLNKAYRMAVFIMLAGVLLAPLPALSQSSLPGQAVVLAGYLGLATVFVGLFIVLAKVTATDCALSFCAGFSALYAGEAIGLACADLLAQLGIAIGVTLAGGIALLSYVFLFTERDFDALSQIASAADTFEETCARIAADFGLSKREAEILAYALRGRTSERIAQELVIAKSTVDTHLRRIYGKCGVHSRQELLDLAESLAKEAPAS